MAGERRPGNGFVQEPIVPAAFDAAMVPSLEHLGVIPEGAVVNCAGDDDAAVAKKRCKKEFVSDFWKTWFVQCSQLQAQRCGWSHLGVGKRQFKSRTRSVLGGPPRQTAALAQEGRGRPNP